MITTHQAHHIAKRQIRPLALFGLILLASLLLGGAAKAPAANAPAPILELSCDKGKTATLCLDRKVTLKAQMAGHGEGPENMVMQHPMMTSPIETEYQDYTVLSANLGQVVVISKAGVTCTKAELKGTLSRYTMHCDEGQGGKCEYSNYVLRADSVKCLPVTK